MNRRKKKQMESHQNEQTQTNLFHRDSTNTSFIDLFRSNTMQLHGKVKDQQESHSQVFEPPGVDSAV